MHLISISTYSYVFYKYIPPRIKSVCPENDGIFENLKTCIQDYSKKWITNFNNNNIINDLIGDLNARTGSLIDFVELDELSRPDHDLLPSNYLEDIILPSRQNVDQIVNDQGKYLLDTCIESKLRILNGRIIRDSLGYNIYFGPRGK